MDEALESPVQHGWVPAHHGIALAEERVACQHRKLEVLRCDLLPSVGQRTAEFDEFGKRPRNGMLKARYHSLRIGAVERGEVAIAEDAFTGHDPVTDRNGKIDELEYIESGFLLEEFPKRVVFAMLGEQGALTHESL